MATPILLPLTENERAMMDGYSHWCQFTHNDLTQAAVNTAQVFTVYTSVADDQIRRFAFILAEPFQNTADAAYNSTAARAGVTGTDNAFITATELNKNGTTLYHAYSTGAGLPADYTAATATQFLVTFASMAGKALVNLNKGRLIVLAQLFHPDKLMKLPSTFSEFGP